MALESVNFYFFFIAPAPPILKLPSSNSIILKLCIFNFSSDPHYYYFLYPTFVKKKKKKFFVTALHNFILFLSLQTMKPRQFFFFIEFIFVLSVDIVKVNCIYWYLYTFTWIVVTSLGKLLALLYEVHYF